MDKPDMVTSLLKNLYIFSLIAFMLGASLPVAAAKKNGAIRAVEESKNCEGKVVSPKVAGNFCEARAFLKENILAMTDLDVILGDIPVILLGDTHPNSLLKKWLARNLGFLKSAGFTHVALEALNSESQPLLDSYFKNSKLRAQVVKLVADDWGWLPEEHVRLIDAIYAAGLKVVAIDNRNELDRKGLGNDIQLRNIHMTEQILDSLSEPAAGRVIVLTGKRHSSWISDEAGVVTLPAMLKAQSVSALSYDLESGEDAVPNNITQAFLYELGLQALPLSPQGDYFLPTAIRDSTVNGLIFISR